MYKNETKQNFIKFRTHNLRSSQMQGDLVENDISLKNFPVLK